MIAFLLTSFSLLAILGAGGLPHVYASGGATLVQQNNAGCFELGSACTSVSVAFSSNVASGDIIVVGIETSQRGDSLAFSSISDSRGFTYTQATNVCDSQPDCAYIYYATATTGGADTITVSLTGGNSIDGTSSADVNIYEVSGVRPLDWVPLLDQSHQVLHLLPHHPLSPSRLGHSSWQR